MNSKVMSLIKEYNMLKQNDAVVIGVSGGADSMCLLHFLCTLREKLNLNIIAAHVNYHLRGQESDDEQRFVEAWCKTHSIACEVMHTNAGEGGTNKKFSEALGREQRYSFFESLAGKNGKIATAHTLSDHTETVIYNLTRGSGTTGMCGIPPVRGNIIRPLRNVTRAQVEHYCKHHQISFKTDSSNNSDQYTRNKIRHNVVTCLKEINPELEEAVLRFTNQLSDQNFVFDHLVEEALNKARSSYGYSCKELEKLNKGLLSACIVQLARNSGIKNLSSRLVGLIKEIIFSGKGTVQLNGKWEATASQGLFRVYKVSETKNNVEIPLDRANGLEVYNKKISTSLVTGSEYNKIKNVNKKFLKNLLDYDIIGCNTIIRTRRAGDTFSALGRNVTKSLKKLFIEQKVPKEHRDTVLLLAKGSEVLWIEGFGAAQQASVCETTKQIMQISVENI